MTMATQRKEVLIGAWLGFRGLVHCHYSRMHGGTQPDKVVEKEPIILQLDWQV